MLINFFLKSKGNISFLDIQKGGSFAPEGSPPLPPPPHPLPPKAALVLLALKVITGRITRTCLKEHVFLICKSVFRSE